MTMLQFSGIFINLSVRHTTRVPLWCTTQQLVTAYSTISNPELEPLGDNSNVTPEKKAKETLVKLSQGKDVKVSKIAVQKLFNENANEIEKLLSSINMKTMTPELSLKYISKLSFYIKTGKAKVADFESDARYKSLCNFLFINTSSVDKNKNNELQIQTQEFRVKHLGFLFDMNEIHNTIEKKDLSIQEAIQVLTKLGTFRSRIVPVLQSLVDHIVKNEKELNIKNASDILYNMSILNFYDENLIQRILPTLLVKIPLILPKNSAVVGSILKSIGLLRYRNEQLLTTLTTWILHNYELVKPRYICSYLVTLAVLGYTPKNDLEKFQAFTSQLTENDMTEQSEWLDVVWSLVILNQAQEAQVMSVLNTEFLEKLSVMTKLTEIKKRKILNINAAAKLIFNKNTDDFLKQKASMFDVTLEKNRENQEFVRRIVLALFAFLPSTGCVNMDVNTGMGFAIDAEFYIDNKCKPVLLSQINSKGSKALKLAVQSLTYYDHCRGDGNVIGLIHFQNSLLRLMGYQIIPVSYNDFKLNQKILEHVKYLRSKINEIVKKSFPENI